MLKWKAVLALSVAVLVLAAMQAQQQPRTHRSLTAQDYADIKQLYARYAISTDTGNGEQFAGVFTEDGAFVTNGLPGGKRSYIGRQQLTEVGSRPGFNRGPTNVTHVYANVTIEPSAEGATGTAYALLLDLGKDGSPSGLKGGGVYRDVLVKGPEGWRIKHRTYLAAHTEGP